MNTDSAVRPVRLPVVWNDSSGVSEKQFRLRQSFQSARPISGRPCGPEVLEHVVERALAGARTACALFFGLVVEGHLLVEDREVAGLLDVGGGARDQPQRVVVEAAADVVVAALGERLVLVVGAAVGRTAWRRCRGCAPGRAPAPGARSRAGPGWSRGSPCRGRCPVSKYEAERDMLKVTMHWYGFQMLTMRSSRSSPRLDLVLREHVRPVVAQLGERRVHLLGGREARRSSPRAGSLLTTPGFSHFSSTGFST